ncbi:MAG: helix-turn-helix domain-containing protein [Muribaculaceae bacterium]|nr:helix-turn-helix domain-containing protein [Muribaculaceae bacterium]
MEITHNQNLSARLGDTIRRLWMARGWSQEEMASNGGVGRCYMSDQENGKRNPSLDVTVRVAAGLGISLAELLRQAESGEWEIDSVDALKQWLTENGYEEAAVFENPDDLTTLVGISGRGCLVYSYSRMVSHLVATEGMNPEEAVEFIDYNIVRALPYTTWGSMRR